MSLPCTSLSGSRCSACGASFGHNKKALRRGRYIIAHLGADVKHFLKFFQILKKHWGNRDFKLDKGENPPPVCDKTPLDEASGVLYVLFFARLSRSFCRSPWHDARKTIPQQGCGSPRSSYTSPPFREQSHASIWRARANGAGRRRGCALTRGMCRRRGIRSRRYRLF